MLWLLESAHEIGVHHVEQGALAVEEAADLLEQGIEANTLSPEVQVREAPLLPPHLPHRPPPLDR